MFFDLKLFALAVFLIINFLVLFVAKARNTVIISLIVAHLFAVLFFSVSISNYSLVKEIILGLVAYSMVILFLISNNDSLQLGREKDGGTKEVSGLIFIKIFVSIVLLLFFLSSFFIVKNISEISDFIHNKKMVIEAEEKQFTEEDLQKFGGEISKTNKQKAQLKRKLSDNFLLKHSSDVILILSGLITISLILSKKEKEDKP